MIELSEQTEALIQRLFSSEHHDEVRRALEEECADNLPLMGKTPRDKYRMERWRFAALKLGRGDIVKFRDAMRICTRDWRDLLVWAGFGNDLQAHTKWASAILGEDQENSV
jgi:hypothetical protein